MLGLSGEDLQISLRVDLARWPRACCPAHGYLRESDSRVGQEVGSMDPVELVRANSLQLWV